MSSGGTYCLFIHLQLAFKILLLHWFHWLKWKSFSHLKELSKQQQQWQKNTKKTAMYWLLPFTLAPSDQATNTLWCLTAWHGLMTDDSWHPFFKGYWHVQTENVSVITSRLFHRSFADRSELENVSINLLCSLSVCSKKSLSASVEPH